MNLRTAWRARREDPARRVRKRPTWNRKNKVLSFATLGFSVLGNTLSAYQGLVLLAILEGNWVRFLRDETEYVPVSGVGLDGTLTTSAGEVFTFNGTYPIYFDRGVWFMPETGALIASLDATTFWKVGGLAALALALMSVIVLLVLQARAKIFREDNPDSRSVRALITSVLLLQVVLAVSVATWAGVLGGMGVFVAVVFVLLLGFIVIRGLKKHLNKK